ncbi:MAG: hypothetical protein MI746_08965 [Pseudomonadales bacterium]|nr:hypothetical protein [Pseudomonadales bacterium]
MPGQWEAVEDTTTLFRAAYEVPGTTPYSTAVRLSDDKLMIYSPGPGLELALPADTPADIELLLLAPCTGHNLGLEPWLEAHATARAFAPEGVQERLRKKKRDTSRLRPIEELESELPEQVRLYRLPENKFHEIWISVDEGSTTYWLFGDAVLNFETLEANFIMKFLLGVYGVREGLNVHKLFLRGLKDKPGFKQWALPLFDNDNRHVLLPCHREIYTDPDCRQRMVSILNAIK